VVVRISWPSGCYTRRFQAFKGDSIRILVKSPRSISDASGDEGGNGPNGSQENLHHDPIGTPRDFQALGMAGTRMLEPIDEENRSHYPIPSDGCNLQMEEGCGLCGDRECCMLDTMLGTIDDDDWAKAMKGWFDDEFN